jgi:hypothetical protein
VYSLAWWENPAQKDKSNDELFANFRGCYINVFRGKILSEEQLTTQGYPARDTNVLSQNGLAVDNRVIRVGPDSTLCGPSIHPVVLTERT